MGAFKEMLIEVTDWVDNLRKIADEDKDIAYSIYRPDLCKGEFAIVGGWMEGFNEEQSDLLYISESNPKYAMCIKVVVDDGPWAFAEFETLNMPVTEDGEVDDTCIAIERDDDSESVALFYLNEIDRISKTYNN